MREHSRLFAMRGHELRGVLFRDQNRAADAVDLQQAGFVPAEDGLGAHAKTLRRLCCGQHFGRPLLSGVHRLTPVGFGCGQALSGARIKRLLHGRPRSPPAQMAGQNDKGRLANVMVLRSLALLLELGCR